MGMRTAIVSNAARQRCHQRSHHHTSGAVVGTTVACSSSVRACVRTPHACDHRTLDPVTAWHNSPRLNTITYTYRHSRRKRMDTRGSNISYCRLNRTAFVVAWTTTNASHLATKFVIAIHIGVTHRSGIGERESHTLERSIGAVIGSGHIERQLLCHFRHIARQNSRRRRVGTRNSNISGCSVNRRAAVVVWTSREAAPSCSSNVLTKVQFAAAPAFRPRTDVGAGLRPHVFGALSSKH